MENDGIELTRSPGENGSRSSDLISRKLETGFLRMTGLRAIEKQMSDTRSEATKDEIAACAYFIWEQEGKPVGPALDHWLQAELQLAVSLWHEEGRPSAAPH
jgi:hypothetical protein